MHKRILAILLLSSFAYAVQAVQPSCTTHTFLAGGPVQLACTNPNSPATNATILAVTEDGSTPTTNGLGTVVTNGFALEAVTAGGTNYVSYFTINVPGLTVKVVAGVNGQTDSTALTLTPTVPVQTILYSSFAFQCGPGTSGNCPPVSNPSPPPTTIPQWPTSGALPCLIRLHDSKTMWPVVEPAPNTFVWTTLDGYVKDILANPTCAQGFPLLAAQQFTNTPCWAAASPVTGFAGSSGSLTFTNTGTNGFQSTGSTTYLTGFTGPNTALNGQTVTVQSAGLTNTTFQATVTGSGYSSGTGFASYANNGSQCQGFSGTNTLPNYGNNTYSPPSDLGTGPDGLSSAAFNNYVSTLLSECASVASPSACPITLWQISNEWDLCVHYQGTLDQLYNWISYPAQLIHAAIPNAIIIAPSATPAANGAPGCQSGNAATDQTNWLTKENTRGRISDWVDWHDYLTTGGANTTLPENQWATFNAAFLTSQAGVAGFVNSPWVDGETNFSAATGYACGPSWTSFDCAGQIVRWQLLHACYGLGSNTFGNVGLFWYYWNSTFVTNPGIGTTYQTPYLYAQNYMIGSRCTTQPTNPIGTTWTAGMAEPNGVAAQWVWTTSEAGGQTFTVPAGYTQYKDLTGAVTPVTPGNLVTITTQPIMLESPGRTVNSAPPRFFVD